VAQSNDLLGDLTKEFIYMLGLGLSIGIEKKNMQGHDALWPVQFLCEK
jgi:hypothetical protein